MTTKQIQDKIKKHKYVPRATMGDKVVEPWDMCFGKAKEEAQAAQPQPETLQDVISARCSQPQPPQGEQPKGWPRFLKLRRELAQAQQERDQAIRQAHDLEQKLQARAHVLSEAEGQVADLLKALKALKRCFDVRLDFDGRAQAYDKARAAIARAEKGGQP